MRPAIFDRMTRQVSEVTLGDGLSRRETVRLLAGVALGGLLIARHAPVEAKRRGKGKRKKNKTKAQKVTCQDGTRNGSETDVDCGGSCPRCAPGKTCAGRNDCATALCTGGTCQQCVLAADCGVDSDGSMCACRENAAQQRVCTKLNGRFIAGGTCADCVAGEQCTLPPGGAECLFPCGV
jgi:hypothetical protein